MTNKQLYRFGGFTLEPDKRLLALDGEPLSLPGKAFEILLVLVGRAGTPVDKDELMKLVWPDTVVEENNLTVAISVLRKALKESKESPAERRFIATIPGRGYQFVAEVTRSTAEAGLTLEAAPPTQTSPPALATISDYRERTAKRWMGLSFF